MFPLKPCSTFSSLWISPKDNNLSKCGAFATMYYLTKKQTSLVLPPIFHINRLCSSKLDVWCPVRSLPHLLRGCASGLQTDTGWSLFQWLLSLPGERRRDILRMSEMEWSGHDFCSLLCAGLIYSMLIKADFRMIFIITWTVTNAGNYWMHWSESLSIIK